MPYFETEDHCRIYYEVQESASSNPGVVFLNGTMQTTLHWKPNALAFQDKYRVLLYDARGQGQSELGKQGLSVERHVDDLVALLNHLQIDKTSLVGVSHGAYIALAFAVHAAGRVEKLLLCGVAATPSMRSRLILKSWREILKRSGLETMVWASLPVVFGENYLREKEKILPMIVRGMVRRNEKESLLAQLEAMDGYGPLSEFARKVECPTLVMSASDDPMVTEEGARALSRLCSGRHEHVDGYGHSLPAEKPQWFNATVLEFLGKAE